MQPSTPALPRLSEAVGADEAHRSQPRLQVVDVARGIGMVLVVLGHAIGGLVDAGLMHTRGAGAWTFHLIYTFHMPLFFLLAGVFVQARLRGGVAGYLGDGAFRIAWPYLLWSVATLMLIDSLGTLVNRPAQVDAARLVALLWEPAAQFWFLHALLVLHLASALLVPRVGAGGYLAVMACAYVVAIVVELPVALSRPMRFGLFHALGVFAGPWLVHALGAVSRRNAALMAAVLGFACLAAAQVVLAQGLSYWSAGALPAAACGTAAVLLLARSMPATAAAPLAFIGRCALAVFAVHVIFVAGTRIALHKLLGVDVAAWLLPLLVAAGLAGPLLLRTAAARAGLARWLGLA